VGFVTAWRRVCKLLASPELRSLEESRVVLVEPFVAGPEVAVEGILSLGRLVPLAIFDKPDPLDGPFFEETIYVTPSRHGPAVRDAIVEVSQRAARAVDLREGPIHAELRLSPSGPQVIEVAARSIGGLCSRTLRFGLGATSLEELVLLHAVGEYLPPVEMRRAAGVMMIPIPKAGVLRVIEGVDAAKAVPLIEDVVVTVRPGEVLVPLPEGSSYLGFIFARQPEDADAPDPAVVEAAIRSAHGELRFEITPTLERAG
jgi:hypothetical protein